MGRQLGWVEKERCVRILAAGVIMTMHADSIFTTLLRNDPPPEIAQVLQPS
jgi:hypothetical protein